MGIAVISLIILAVVALIAIPVLVAVFGRASKRNENLSDSEDSGDEDPGRRSGPRRG